MSTEREKSVMRWMDEFRDSEKARGLIDKIKAVLAQSSYTAERPLLLTELCGGHTHTIFRYGLRKMLPPSIEFLHGPGCPVCVLPASRVDDAVAVASLPDVILTAFGDVLRVPGSQKSLLQAKAQGADIRPVYSPADALALARKMPEKKVVFFAIGFETTAPATALTLKQAKNEGLKNFFVLGYHIKLAPIVEALLADPQFKTDGFIAPGHVSLVIGTGPYRFMAEQYRKPTVVAGFEPLDILQAVLMLAEQAVAQKALVENQYKRFVKAEGNLPALQALNDVFAPRENFEWRGLGNIPFSGFKIREEFSAFDAEKYFAASLLTGDQQRVRDPEGCQCSEVVIGVLKPWQCRMFGTKCTPQTPLGALMVSSEGSCAAYWQYAGVTKNIQKQEKEKEYGTSC